MALVRAGARASARATRERTAVPTAAQLPVARVAVDVPLPHLDRPFDYLVPATLDDAAMPGVRVRVRFAGQLVDGFLLERAAAAEHEGVLARLQRVVSPEPVLTPEVLALARAVAARYAGTLVDVLRLAVPPRHGGAEAEPAPARAPHPPAEPSGEGDWSRYENGPGFLRALASGGAPRAVWPALPGRDWAAPVAEAVAAVRASGRGAVVALPDATDAARLSLALDRTLGRGEHVVLAAELGPAERYRRWLAVRRGAVRVAIGPRAVAFAPVVDLGLVVCWDDGDDLHGEPRAPYPHTREVLCLRAHAIGAAALLGGFAVTAEDAALMESGWAHPVPPLPDQLRRSSPRIRAAAEDLDLERDPAARAARLPNAAWRAAREGLRIGPVLVQVPRRGYLPALGCLSCRAPARCGTCRGPLALEAERGPARCRWCGRGQPDWRCAACGGDRFRAVRYGTARTAEELGRAFPGVPVRTAAPGPDRPRLDASPTIVVSTPGIEPVVDGGYTAALLLDGQVLLSRPDLRAAEEAVRRWLNASALVRPGGAVYLGADPNLPAVQTVVRWDPLSAARRELADRAAASFPPAVRLATLTGPSDAVAEMLALVELPPGTEVMGPVAIAEDPTAYRAVLRTRRTNGRSLAAALRAAAGVRSARKSPGSVRVRIDPVEVD